MGPRAQARGPFLFYALRSLWEDSRVASNPNSQQLLQQALDAFNRGNAVVAESACLEALKLAPEHTSALAILGLAYHAQSRYTDSIGVFEGLVGSEPAESTHWMNLATARRCNGQFDAALTAYARGAQLGGTSADFYYNVGLTHLDRLDYESARSVLARAVELAPRDAEIRFEYARACYESLHTDEAISALRGWEQLDGLRDDLIANIGHRLMSLGESESAQETVARLANSQNLEPRASLTLAQILERTNRIADARVIVDRLLASAAAPSLGVDLKLTAAQLAQREARHENAVQLFKQALTLCVEFHQRHTTLFALVKSLDALARYEEAFTTLEEAHRSQVEHFKLTAPLVTARGAPTMSITRHSCEPRDIDAWDASDGPSTAASPIFIVAFPRSGTTLLELTLDAHPKLKSMDEQPFLHQALDDLLATGHDYPSELGKVTTEQLTQIRERYWARVNSKVTLVADQRLVDKNPLNLLRLPVIQRVFPNARIVLAIRHPYDVLLSCFMQHFRAPDFALLCVDLPTLADAYRRSFDFWYRQAELLRPTVREIRYETLVENFAGEVRALSEFLELPWHDAMLAPAEHAQAKGFISTPSYSQVIQPVNKKSVARWRRYAPHFESVAPIIQPYLDRWRYEG